jgi:DNA replication protein DnaC
MHHEPPPGDELRRVQPSDLPIPRPASPSSRLAPSPAAQPPACRHCSNSGHIKVDLATARAEALIVLETYPIADRTVARIPCSCAAGRAVVARWRSMPPDADGVTLDSLAGVPDQDQATCAVEEFIARPRGWLTFAGGYGVGKTLLVYAALNHLADLGMYGCYLTAPDLIDGLRALIREGGDPDARLRRWIEAPLLAVDELDKYDQTEFAEKTIFRLFHARYQAWQTTGTLLSYNADREQRLPPFLLSRMRDSRFRRIVLPGADLRPMAAELDAWDRGEGEA